MESNTNFVANGIETIIRILIYGVSYYLLKSLNTKYTIEDYKDSSARIRFQNFIVVFIFVHPTKT